MFLNFFLKCREIGKFDVLLISASEQWIAMDDISNNYANQTLKLTTRQTFQFHGILKRSGWHNY
jgi:hypothetical protein